MTGVIPDLRAHILAGNKDCIVAIDTICLKSSEFFRLRYFNKASVETDTSRNPVSTGFAVLSGLVALSTGNSNILVSRCPRDVRHEILILQVNLMSQQSLEMPNSRLLLSRERDREARNATNLR